MGANTWGICLGPAKLEAKLATAALSLFRLTSSRNVLPLFAATVFLSAGLMFLVEPMVAKMVLPRLGGSPFVWTTCLVFFQAMLLIGYAYAHALTRMAQRGRQVFIHLGIMLLAALTLPLGLGADAPPAGELPSWWLLMRLTLTAGPAVFVISATAPLLQSWFSALDVGAVGDPYFLYAGSNAGSLLALLTYPLLFEPAFELDKQALLWSAGFSALIISVALCAVPTLLRAKPALPSAPQADPTQSRLLERLRWTALAMAPSSLLLGVTTHITTDIVSAPLLWVVPLAAYLLSFIVAFARRSPVPHAAAVRVMPIVLIPLITTMAPGMQTALPFQLFLPVGALFVIALVCHGELARLRPPPARLTDFYFFVSLGGGVGRRVQCIVGAGYFSRPMGVSHRPGGGVPFEARDAGKWARGLGWRHRAAAHAFRHRGASAAYIWRRGRRQPFAAFRSGVRRHPAGPGVAEFLVAALALRGRRRSLSARRVSNRRRRRHCLGPQLFRRQPGARRL